MQNPPGTKPPEIIDVVDPTGKWVGTATRAKVHSEGLWHNVFHCLIIRTVRPERVVLQRRHASSKAFPRCVDFSATGHLMAGEKPADGVREIAEELGIVVDPSQLVSAGVRLLADNSGEGMNRERVHLHFLVDDRPLDAFRPSPDEVTSVIEVVIDDVLHLLDNYGHAPLTEVDAMEWLPGAALRQIKLTASELVPPTDGYWTTALVAAKRFAQGESPIGI